MAVVIASALDKDIAGAPLFRDVSFKLERRDRMTLAGRNGAGKTTLLRMLSGETGVDGGELVLAKGTRARPARPAPAARARRSRCATTCSPAAATWWRSRSGCASSRPPWASAPTTHALLDRYAKAQARLEHAGGWDWRARALGPLHGLGFADDALDRQPRRLLGRRAHARVARAGARGRPGPAAARRAHQPPRHRVARMARGLPHRPRRRRRAGGPRPLVPRGGGHVGARAGGGPGRASSPAPGTPGAGRARARELQLGRAIDKQQAEIERMERFIERFRAKATKARQVQSRVKAIERMPSRRARPARHALARLRSSGPPSAPAAWCSTSRARASRSAAARSLDGGDLWLERGEHVSLVGPNGAGKTTLIEAHRRQPRARTPAASAAATT